MRIALGTAQFGMNYGVTNETGKISPAEQQRLIDYFIRSNHSYLDTAPSYGDAEESLGKILALHQANIRVVTKGVFLDPSKSLKDQLRGSLRNLKRTSLYAFLVHDFFRIPHALLPKLAHDLQELRDEGLTLNVGASLYSPEELDLFLRYNVGNIIQIPLNPLDWRFPDSSLLTEARSRAIEIHARSLFLQGLLLADPDQLPAHLKALHHDIDRFRSFASSRSLTPLQACWAFARAQTSADVIIIGVEGLVHLRQHLELAVGPYSPTLNDFASCKSSCPLLDPRRWSDVS